MADIVRPVVAVLAAGSSKRFGKEDKLACDFRGEMLGVHSIRAIPRQLFSHAWVIAADARHPCTADWNNAGFEVQINERSANGMGTSVALAAQLAIRAQAGALLITLADMPLVPASHFGALFEAGLERGFRQAVSSCDGKTPQPPAMFGPDQFETLARINGDQGAKGLLEEGYSIDCPQHWLADVDTPAALAALQ